MGISRWQRGEARPITPIIDRAAAIKLSASLAHENRLDFAQTFTTAITLAYSRILTARPDMPDLLALPPHDGATLGQDARELAAGVASGLEALSPAEVAYAIGTLYTTLLPAPFRSRHGIYYTPPELVECLLVGAEEAGIDWRTARVLDPACGGGAFLIGLAGRMARALKGTEPALALQSIAARLRGFDLDPFGAWLAQAMLAIALEPLACSAGRKVPWLAETRDSLDLNPDEAESYDLVIGNPPPAYHRHSASNRLISS